MKVVTLDFETRSAVNITTRGGGVYMEHETTDALLASYSFDGKTINRWRREQPMPDDLREHVASGGVVRAFNASFERGIWRILARKHGWLMPRDEQFRCSKATAAALGLPRNLDGLAKALNLPVQKDSRGKELIQKFSIPRARDGDVYLFNEPEDFPADFEVFHDYCDFDVLVECAADERMVPLSDQEQLYWLLDQRINERGVRFDVESLDAAIELAETARSELDRKMQETTGGAVKSCDEIANLLAWLAAQGVDVPSLGKDELLRALRRPDLPPGARNALELREQAAKSSTRKLVAIKRRLSRDGRLRGVFIYHGTHPGRWTSAGGVNLANLPRSREAFSELRKDVLFKAIRTRRPTMLSELYGPELGKPLHLLADAVRSFIWAAPGHDLIACDYSAIQGRVAAWLAGEEWKIRAYEEIDRDPTAPDLYRRAASAMTGIPLDVLTKKHPLRQIGKTSELALQFQSGVVGFHAMAVNYNLTLEDFFDQVWSVSSLENQERAVKSRERALKMRDKRKADVLSREAWLTAELSKLSWRDANSNMTRAWSALENTARFALLYPGQQFQVCGGKVVYLVANGFLWCKLPSGRCIAYAAPKLVEQVMIRYVENGQPLDIIDRVDRLTAERMVARGEAIIEQSDKEIEPRVSVVSVDAETGRFQRYGLYGGLQLENLCLGIERDILAAGMVKLESAGYRIVSHVYDEAVAEVPHDFGSPEHMAEIMSDTPEWANGLPISADGWRGKRYRKA